MKWLRHFIVYRCAGCGDAVGEEQVFCGECARAFHEECASACRKCGSPHTECSCFANGKKSPFDRVLHIAPYRGAGVAHNTVILCKDTEDKTLFSFIAYTVASEISRKVTLTEDTVLIPIPRSPASRLKHGFDQALTVARQAAKELNVPCVEAFTHKRSALQKSLTYRERFRNAGAAFALKEKVAPTLKGKHVILYDDVTTTGATAAACAKLLKSAGVARMDFCSFAKSE